MSGLEKHAISNFVEYNSSKYIFKLSFTMHKGRTCSTNAISTAVVEAHFVDDLSWRPTIVSPLARICAQVGEALVE